MEEYMRLGSKIDSKFHDSEIDRITFLVLDFTFALTNFLIGYKLIGNSFS